MELPIKRNAKVPMSLAERKKNDNKRAQTPDVLLTEKPKVFRKKYLIIERFKIEMRNSYASDGKLNRF